MPEEEKKVAEQEEELLFGDSAPKKEFEPVDEGEYEVRIESYEYRTTSSGKRQLNFKLRIRDDVEQKNKGRVLFYSITEKENDRAFNYYRINKLLVSTKNCPEYREKFKEFDEILQYLVGRQFLLYTTVMDGTNGKPFNQIDDDTFEVSKWNVSHPAAGPKVVQSSEPVAKNTEQLDLPDQELPF